MKGRKKSMRTIREVLRLHFEHDLSQRAIARACAVSPTTVGEHLERLRQTGLDWPAVAALEDSFLKTVLFPLDAVAAPRKVMPDFDYLRAEMRQLFLVASYPHPSPRETSMIPIVHKKTRHVRKRQT